jgi:hypothetical protein
MRLQEAGLRRSPSPCMPCAAVDDHPAEPRTTFGRRGSCCPTSVCPAACLSASQAATWAGSGGEAPGELRGPGFWGLLDRMHAERRTCNLVYRVGAGQGFIWGQGWCSWRGSKRYSRKVQQLTRTRGDVRGRGRTVTCRDGRGWTCCRQMACKRSAVRARLAPPGQPHNSNNLNAISSGW